MCHSNRGPRCSTCHKPAPRHRCRCPAKYASNPTLSHQQHDGPPSYAAVMEQQSPISTPLPSSYSRCGQGSYRRCGYQRRRCQGPIHSLVSLILRKVQEKKEREEATAKNLREEERIDRTQERGVIEAVDEKLKMESGEVRGEEGKDGVVKIVTKSMRGMSL